MATFNVDTSIFSEAENTLKQNTQGQKPYRYFTQNFDSAPASDFTTVGQLRPGNGLGPRSQPTQINELPTTTESHRRNAAFLGGGTMSLESVDAQSELRWGGKMRNKKGQQLTSEMGLHRNTFLAPDIETTQGYQSSRTLSVNPDFIRGDGLTVPNFSVAGNNQVSDIRFGFPTRNERLVVGESGSV